MLVLIILYFSNGYFLVLSIKITHLIFFKQFHLLHFGYQGFKQRFRAIVEKL